MGMGQNRKKWFASKKLEIQGEMIRKPGRKREHLSSTDGSQGALSWASYRLACHHRGLYGPSHQWVESSLEKAEAGDREVL